MPPTIGKRIVIIGISGSGKSTLGKRLASRLGVEFIELDALHWEPNWVEAETEVFRERVRRAIEPDSWVMDGNYRKQIDLSWPLTDTVVWLDTPFRTAFWRCLVRSWKRYRSRELLWGTNQENFWEHLMLWNPQRSLLGYMLRNYRSRRRLYLTAMQSPRWSHITFVHLRSAREMEKWVDQIQI